MHWSRCCTGTYRAAIFQMDTKKSPSCRRKEVPDCDQHVGFLTQSSLRLRLRSLKALRAQLPLKSMGVRYLNKHRLYKFQSDFLITKSSSISTFCAINPQHSHHNMDTQCPPHQITGNLQWQKWFSSKQAQLQIHTNTFLLYLRLASALYTIVVSMVFRVSSLGLQPGDREQNPTPTLQVQAFFTWL